MSIPSKPFLLHKSIAVEIKEALRSGDAAIVTQVDAGTPVPPIDIITFKEGFFCLSAITFA